MELNVSMILKAPLEIVTREEEKLGQILCFTSRSLVTWVEGVCGTRIILFICDDHHEMNTQHYGSTETFVNVRDLLAHFPFFLIINEPRKSKFSHACYRR